MLRLPACCLAVMLLLVIPATVRASDPSLADGFLSRGQARQGITDLAPRVQAHPTDQQLRYNLGVLQFVRALEHLAQSLYRYGLQSHHGADLGIPFLRLPLPTNPKPQPLDHPTARAILSDFVKDLRAAESTLAEVSDPAITLPIRVGRIRLDVNGSGQDGFPLVQWMARSMGGQEILERDPDLCIVFDRASVAWFRGYCHLLMALGETALGHDTQELFDCSAHLFFAKPRTPHAFLHGATGKDFQELAPGVDVVDVITFIHVVRLPVKDGARLKAALDHLKQALALSRETWRFVMANDTPGPKWIPNPRQQGVLGIHITQAMVDGWLSFVDESEALLDGRVLLPFWRGGEKRGVNLKRVFTEPRPLDLVLWVQGSAATPYLEEGPLTRKEMWRNLERLFRGQFIGFAIWFN